MQFFFSLLILLSSAITTTTSFVFAAGGNTASMTRSQSNSHNQQIMETKNTISRSSTHTHQPGMIHRSMTKSQELPHPMMHTPTKTHEQMVPWHWSETQTLVPPPPPSTTTTVAPTTNATTTTATVVPTTTTTSTSVAPSTTAGAAANTTTTTMNQSTATTSSAPTFAPTTTAQVGIPRVRFSVSAAANATGNVTVANFKNKLALLLGVPASSLSVTIESTGIVTVEFISSNGNATTEATAALALNSDALQSLGAASATSLAPATTAAPSDSASDILPLIISCAVGGFVLHVIILLVVKKSSSGGSGTTYLEDDRPMLTVPQQRRGNRDSML
jgi:hypothetical protein